MRVHEVSLRQTFDFQQWQLLSRKASTFSSAITLISEEHGLRLDAKSVLGIMASSLRAGTRVRIVTRGRDEEEALDAMCELLE
ncbi:HPr family phosphocarrier protein [Paenibacillus sp. YYML68]|uniref:HPr family phosphocarrier protein n=1 Tax=Paenibacillus sp. YYML68 TaxID=2909250 RepID=UPI00248FE987|nr:HPr family phosphocarrier protein [Paenibacillus sp. YYML68]